MDANDPRFENYLNQMDKTISRLRNDTSHWADVNIVIATSSLLNTPIVCYSPHTIGNVRRRRVWYEVIGVNMVGPTVYDPNFEPFELSEKKIVLNNESGQHFEPAVF